MKQKNKLNLWILCSIIAAFFAPAGLIFEAVLVAGDRKKYPKKDAVLLFCAIGVLFFSLTMTVYILYVSFAGSLENTAYLALIYVPGIFYAIPLIIFYFSQADKARKYEKLRVLIDTAHITQIKRLAEITGFTQKCVIDILEGLIRFNVYTDAEVDRNTGYLILRNSMWAGKRAVCNTCGAESTINFGETLVCKYCSGVLSVKSSESFMK